MAIPQRLRSKIKDVAGEASKEGEEVGQIIISAGDRGFGCITVK